MDEQKNFAQIKNDFQFLLESEWYENITDLLVKSNEPYKTEIQHIQATVLYTLTRHKLRFQQKNRKIYTTNGKLKTSNVIIHIICIIL